MKEIIQLRQEIAKMRLMDLTEEHGYDSSRVKNYRRKIRELKMINGDLEFDKSPVQPKRVTAANKLGVYRRIVTY
ncbi:hypothetical protein [Desulforamulus aquiferis]|uniref:50S ribosomal protein L29 n=1 Tax=Desulforamulus aquiferis TaxID=1397668 RepID=A0AAW7ZBS7_9FIRM|nr:hypothetical protein [Desulforamulus aquiferis]MDO7786614.1 hypothetical protein [Desulforamulus aquiferis]